MRLAAMLALTLLLSACGAPYEASCKKGLEAEGYSGTELSELAKACAQVCASNDGAGCGAR